MNDQRWALSVFSVAVLGMSAFSGAFAQSRCDCSEIVDSCRAQITEVPIKSPGTRFLIKADTEQCAVVEYSIDGTLGQTTVWDDGDEIDNVSPRKPGGKLAIRSCRVCKDRVRGTGGDNQDDGNAESFCASLANIRRSCGTSDASNRCDATTKSQMQSSWSEAETSYQAQSKLMQQGLASAEKVAATYERMGSDFAGEARKARSFAADERARIKSLQCSFPKIRALVND